MLKMIVFAGPLTAASANAIALSQTPVAGPLIINGASATAGVATLDNPRRVLITTAADESSRTFTITGTTFTNTAISETVAGPNIGTIASNIDFKTVTSVNISGDAAGAVTVGTNGVAGSSWVRFDNWALPQISIQVDVYGTANFTVQQTLDDPNFVGAELITPADVVWVNHPDTNLVGSSTGAQGNYGYMPIFARIVLNSGTGDVEAAFVQSGSVAR